MSTDTAAPFRDLIESVPLPEGAEIETLRIRYEESGVPLSGLLVWDASRSGPRPGVVVVHDWMGEDAYVRARCEMLARLGYVAFAADVYGEGVRPADAEEASALARQYYADLPTLRARVRAGYEVLAGRAEAERDRLAVMGYCFGGSASLEFARTGTPLAGAVSFHGALIVHEPADVASLDAPLLVLTGAADPVVPDETVVAFENELRQRAGLDWQIVSYSDTPHAFTRPGIDAYRPRADARSWRAMADFFDEIFA
ncbi:dienelactone hydrolase family protein [Herbiconiux sp. A18JL235]|uniref:Dienelactone hydrolase family protein n=1 Tax=Herbiconiux sp. A18JL235 TaxID=3152363 RepID=A0AB39BCZ0_9MICO